MPILQSIRYKDYTLGRLDSDDASFGRGCDNLNGRDELECRYVVFTEQVASREGATGRRLS